MQLLVLVLLLHFGLGLASSSQGASFNGKEQITYTINSELQVIESKIENYKKILDLEDKKAAVLKKIREEILNGNKIIGKRDGQVETTWTLEEISEHVLHQSRFATPLYTGRRGRGEMTLEPTKKPEDMFYEVFVKRNEIALYDDSKVVDLDVLAIPFRGGYSGSRRNKRGAKFAAKTTPNINLVVVTDDKSKLHVYDGESASLLVSLQTDHKENGINSTTCNFEVFDAYCATIGASGKVYVHPLTVYVDRKFMSGNRIPIAKKRDVSGKTDDVIETKEDAEKSISEETQDENAESDEPSKVGIWVKFEDSVLVDTTSTFKSNVEQSGYSFAHSAMGRSRLLLIGNSNGDVGVFRRNGSTYYDLKFELGAKAMPALAGSRAFIAASKGKSIAFLNIGRQTIMKHECHAALADISSIVFDSLNSQILYAASVDGEIFAFNTRARSKHSGLVCKLMYKLQSNSSYAASLYARKGFLLATSNNVMTVYNTSNVLRTIPRLISSHAFKNAIPRMSVSPGDAGTSTGWFGSHSSVKSTGTAKDHAVFSSFSVLAKDKIPDESIYAILLKNTDYAKDGKAGGDKEVCGTNVVSLFTTLLRYDPPVFESDITWLRTPLMILGVGGVFLYQFMGKRRGGGMPNMGGFGGGFPRGGGGLNTNEMGELRNIINRYEKKNGGAGNGDVGGFMRSMGGNSGLGGGSRRRNMMRQM